MRYSAATCDPNDFKDSGFTLRQVLYDPPRRTELFIVLTMYNEDEELFARSMHGVMKNVAHLCKRDRSKTWGKDGWRKVVVCIVSDGRAKINSRTLSAIAAMGIYQEGIAKNAINGKPVTAHIYEYTTQGTYFSIVNPVLFELSKVTPSVYQSFLAQHRRVRTRPYPCTGSILSEGEEPKEDQLPSLVLQRLRSDPPTQRLRSYRCRNHAWAHFYLSLMEGIRYQLKRRRCLR